MAHEVSKKSIQMVYRICLLLAVVTIAEIGMALLHFYDITVYPKLWLDIAFIILSAVKAYYIMSEFMHLKYELKAMQLTILLPFFFLVWGIIAFLWEGNSWLNMQLF